MREGMSSLGQNVCDFCVWFPDYKDRETEEKICSLDPTFADLVSLICCSYLHYFLI